MRVYAREKSIAGTGLREKERKEERKRKREILAIDAKRLVLVLVRREIRRRLNARSNRCKSAKKIDLRGKVSRKQEEGRSREVRVEGRRRGVVRQERQRPCRGKVRCFI